MENLDHLRQPHSVLASRRGLRPLVPASVVLDLPVRLLGLWRRPHLGFRFQPLLRVSFLSLLLRRAIRRTHPRCRPISNYVMKRYRMSRPFLLRLSRISVPRAVEGVGRRPTPRLVPQLVSCLLECPVIFLSPLPVRPRWGSPCVLHLTGQSYGSVLVPAFLAGCISQPPFSSLPFHRWSAPR